MYCCLWLRREIARDHQQERGKEMDHPDIESAERTGYGRNQNKYEPREMKRIVVGGYIRLGFTTTVEAESEQEAAALDALAVFKALLENEYDLTQCDPDSVVFDHIQEEL